MMDVRIKWADGHETMERDVVEIHFNHNGKGDIAFEGKDSGMNVMSGRIVEFEALTAISTKGN